MTYRRKVTRAARSVMSLWVDSRLNLKFETREQRTVDDDSQNESRIPICTSRPGVAASVIVPNCGVFTKRLGVPRFV